MAFQREYPPSWTYVLDDAFEYVRRCLGELDPIPDLVSADPPLQYAPQLFEHLPEWGLFAERYLVATVYRPCFVHDPLTREGREELPTIDGMVDIDLRHRTDFRGGVYWAVYQRV